MPLQFLRELAVHKLPALFAEPADIAKLVRLRELGQIIVLLPSENDTTARVLLITAQGWRTLRGVSRVPSDSSGEPFGGEG